MGHTTALEDTTQSLSNHELKKASHDTLGHLSGVYQENNEVAEGGTAFGTMNKALGNGSFAIGAMSEAIGIASFAGGMLTQATGTLSQSHGMTSRAEGDYTYADGDTSHAVPYASHAQGRLNLAGKGSPTSFQITSDAHIIGNGTANNSRSNAFRVTFDGKTYGLSAFNSTGADYAEFFEWVDGNPDNADRVGHFVTLDGDKIKLADAGDYIVGIVSATASVIGDSHSDQWGKKYITDVWGRPQTEEVEVERKEFDKEGEEVTVTRSEIHMQLNPHWDNEEEYVPREYRKEWDAVGMMGKLYLKDDGTCEVNGYCAVLADGIATASNEGYRVIKRIDANIIKVIIK